MVVEDIKGELDKYNKSGFKVDSKVFIDEEQKVKVGKVNGGSCFVELLEPLDDTSPISEFSKKQKGYHHICIEVENINSYIQFIQKEKLGFRLTKTTTSVWDGRKVCFISTNDRDIIELIEPL